MGSVSQIKSINQSQDVIVRDIINELIEQDGNYYGHQEGYSGSWSAKHGSPIILNKTFNNESEAADFLCNESSKDMPVYAVMVQTTPSVLKKDEKYSKLVSELQDLKNDKSEFIKTKLSERKSKRKTVTCVHCGKHTKTEEVSYSSKCSDCKKTFFYLSKTEYNRLPILDKRIKSKQSQIDSRTRALKVDPKSILKIDTEISSLRTKITKLTNKISSFKSSLKGFKTCKHCKSKINLDIAKKFECEEDHFNCPTCRKVMISKDTNIAYDIYSLNNKIKELDKQKSKFLGIYWLAGGMCRN